VTAEPVLMFNTAFDYFAWGVAAGYIGKVFITAVRSWNKR
jgi:hypothetical protein